VRGKGLGTYLEVCETDDTPEIFEDGNLRYGRRVETRDALSGYTALIVGSQLHIRRREGEEHVNGETTSAQPIRPVYMAGRRYVRGERDAVVDGYQAVEHECCCV
jgi:hypothetical protein